MDRPPVPSSADTVRPSTPVLLGAGALLPPFGLLLGPLAIYYGNIAYRQEASGARPVMQPRLGQLLGVLGLVLSGAVIVYWYLHQIEV